MLKPTDKVSFGLMRSCRDATLVNAEQALLRTGGRAAQISGKTAWAISDWLKGCFIPAGY
jgi:hypothetical protein